MNPKNTILSERNLKQSDSNYINFWKSPIVAPESDQWFPKAGYVWWGIDSREYGGTFF